MSETTTLERATALKQRTKKFALRIVKLFQSLPRSDDARVLGRQLLRSGTSVGANYRSACRARTNKEFISKIRIVVEEADETCYWIELLVEGQIVPERKLAALLTEGNELLAIFAASLRTAQRRKAMTH